MACFLGVDLGTSGVEVVVVDETGRVFSNSSERYSIYSPHPGWDEQDPEEWWMATVKAVNKVLDQAALNSLQIRGVGISWQTHGTVSLMN